MSPAGAVWLYGGPEAGPALLALAQALGRRPGREFDPVRLGPGEDGGGEGLPHLDLGPLPDLGLALLAAPLGLRPAALVWRPGDETQPPLGLDELPCPVLAWGGGRDAPGDASLPLDPGAAAEALAEAAKRGRPFPWLKRVQVNLPLRDLLGRYLPILEGSALNPEVGLDHQALDEMGPADLEEARRVLAGRRITAHLPFMDLLPGSPDPKVAALAGERLRAGAEWALALGARQAVAHLGYSPVMHRDAAAFAGRFAATLAPIAARLTGAGCRLMLENTLEPRPEPLLLSREALEREAGAEIGFCFDVGHAVSFGGGDLYAWWEALGERTGELHLHDNPGQDDLHLPPGRGMADWEYLARAVAGLPRPPVLTLEPHSEPHLWGFLRGLERVWGPAESFGSGSGAASAG